MGARAGYDVGRGFRSHTNWSPCAPRTFKPPADFFNFPGEEPWAAKGYSAATPLTSPAAAFSVAVAATGYFSYGSGVFSPGLDRSEAVIGGDAIETAAPTAHRHRPLRQPNRSSRLGEPSLARSSLKMARNSSARNAGLCSQHQSRPLTFAQLAGDGARGNDSPVKRCAARCRCASCPNLPPPAPWPA